MGGFRNKGSFSGQREVKPLDPQATLWETGNRDLWQSSLFSRDGITVGRVIRQVVETQMYTVRYLVTYCPEQERHILIPSDTLIEITPGCVLCELTYKEIKGLPDFQDNVNRSYETELYQAIERTPYWVEEASVTPRDETES